MTTTADYDFDIALKAYKPDGAVLGFLPHPMSLQVAYPLSEMPSLIFTYPKDDPTANILKQELEIAVVIWIRSRGEWIEPPMSRFIALSWEDDVTDGTNTIKFTCPGYAWLLSKQLIRKGKRDDALNATEAAAQKAWEDAKKARDQAVNKRNGTLSAVKSDLNYKGNVYAHTYFPYKIGKAKKWPKHQSILWHAGRRKFYWYKGSTRKWYLVGDKSVNDRIPTMLNDWNDVVSKQNAFELKRVLWDKAKFNAREATKDGKRPMIGTTAGWAMKRHMDESKSYGGERLKGMGRSFNGTYATGWNSAGKLFQRWPHKFNIDLTIGQSLLDTLEQLTSMGMCEWRTRGRTLDLLKPNGTNLDRSKQVALHLGLDLTDAPDKATRAGYANWLIVKGEKNLSFAMDQGAAGRTGWGSWEKSVQVSGVSKAGSAKKLALKEATEALKKVKLQSTRGLVVRPDGPRPMYDYLPGQTIASYGTDGLMNKVRVMQITLTRDNGGYVSGNLVLGDRFMNKAIDWQRSIARSVGGYESTIGGGSVPMLPAPPAPVIEPEPPLTLAISSRVVIDPVTGIPKVIASLAWSHEQAVPIEPIPEAEEPADEIAPDEADPGDWEEPTT